MRRALALAIALAVLLAVLGLAAPSFFAATHLRGLVVDRLPVLIAALGMTLVIICGQIDVSVGAQLAVLSTLLGTLALWGMPMLAALALTIGAGALLGALHALLVTALRAPALLVTLGTLALLREGLRLVFAGQWIRGLPASFQWCGLGQRLGTLTLCAVTLATVVGVAVLLARTRPGRALYAVGGDAGVAALLGIGVAKTRGMALVALGACMGLCACVHAVRYPTIETEVGLGFELDAIACAVVGGALPKGGRGTVLGTCLGWALFATLGSMLAFLRADPAWEKALAGALLLLGVAADTGLAREESADA